MYIIVGLGNPGREYHRTRHNVGFMALDALATREGLSYPKTGFRCVYGEHRLSGEKVIIAKPDTFMNNSGLAVVQLVNYFKPSLDHLIVIYDDIDLPCGAIRIRENGSAGTHNGMRSIIEQLGREGFIRIRIGIGKPEHDLINHVLSAPDDKDMALLNKAFINASEAIKLIVSGNIEEAQTRYNYKPPKRKSPRKPRRRVIHLLRFRSSALFTKPSRRTRSFLSMRILCFTRGYTGANRFLRISPTA